MGDDIVVGGTESDREEWKEAFTDQLLEQAMETLCAFLNSFGGTIIFGVDRNAAKVGLMGDLDVMQQRIYTEARNHLQPKASHLFNVRGKDGLIAISAKSDPSAIYQYRNVVYKRTGTSTHALTFQQAKELEERRKEGVREVASQTFVQQKVGNVQRCPSCGYREISGMTINMSVGGPPQRPKCPKCGAPLISE